MLEKHTKAMEIILNDKPSVRGQLANKKLKIKKKNHTNMQIN